jgi:MFS family permease
MLLSFFSSHKLRAWAIWFLSATFMFYKYAIEVSPSVMTDTLMSTFGIGAASLGNLTACYFYAYLLLQIPAGILLDRFGPRKTTTLAIVLCALGNLLFSQADTFFMAGVGRFITGVGGAFAAVNCLKLIANWFPQRQFAFMAGLMMTVAMAGAVGGQAPLSSFIQMMDWRTSMEVISVLGLALACVFWLVVRDYPPHQPSQATDTYVKVSPMKSLRTILKNPQSWWLSIYSGLAFAPVMVFGGLWGVSFISEGFNLNQYQSAQVISLIFIGFAVGAPVFGWLSGRFGSSRLVMKWGTLAALVTLTVAIYAPGVSAMSLAILLFLFGFSISSFLLCFTMIREIHSPLVAATAIGFMNAFDALLGAVTDPLTGKCLDVMWDGQMREGARVFSVETYKLAFLALPLYLILSMIMLWMIKEKKAEQVILSQVRS